MKKLLIVAAILAMTGCASGNDNYYLMRTAQLELEKAQQETLKAKYEATKAMVGDSDIAKAIGVMAMWGNSGQLPTPQVMPMPKSNSELFVDLIGALAGPVVQGFGIYTNGVVAKVNSQASVQMEQSRNAMVLGITKSIPSSSNTSYYSSVDSHNSANQANTSVVRTSTANPYTSSSTYTSNPYTSTTGPSISGTVTQTRN